VILAGGLAGTGVDSPGGRRGGGAGAGRKGRIHDLVYGLRSEEIEVAVRFAVLAVVVLPLLPRTVRPERAAPARLWVLVLLFSGLFAGYLGLRLPAPSAVTRWPALRRPDLLHRGHLSFARQSREKRRPAAGTLAACTVLYLRVAVLAAILRPEVAWRAAPYFALPFVVGAGVTLLLRGRERNKTVSAELPRNPLGLRSALQMALFFQLVLYAIAWAKERFGSTALYGTATILGLTDLDALTFSMARSASTAAADAARALTIGILANTALKTVWRWWSARPLSGAAPAAASRRWRSPRRHRCSSCGGR
jgi:uncharacterized membrane protein (DUF4010 family)